MTVLRGVELGGKPKKLERQAAGNGRSRWENKEKAREFEVMVRLFDAVYAGAYQVLEDCLNKVAAPIMRLTDVRTILMPADSRLRLGASKTGKNADFDVSMYAVLPGVVARQRRRQERRGIATSRNRWAMYPRDMRKLASELAGDVVGGSQQLKHSSVTVTRKHCRTKPTSLVPVP